MRRTADGVARGGNGGDWVVSGEGLPVRPDRATTMWFGLTTLCADRGAAAGVAGRRRVRLGSKGSAKGKGTRRPSSGSPAATTRSPTYPGRVKLSDRGGRPSEAGADGGMGRSTIAGALLRPRRPAAQAAGWLTE